MFEADLTDGDTTLKRIWRNECVPLVFSLQLLAVLKILKNSGLPTKKHGSSQTDNSMQVDQGAVLKRNLYYMGDAQLLRM